MRDENLGKTFKFQVIPEFEMFYNEESMWGAYSVYANVEIPQCKYRFLDPLDTSLQNYQYGITLIGKTPRLVIGTEYEVKAILTFSEKHKSYSYEIVSTTAMRPKTKQDQKKYLEAILTPDQAMTLIDVYPNIVNEVIEGTDGVDLNMLKGIGEKRWATIRDKIIEHFALSELMVMLAPLGVSVSKIKSIFNMDSNADVIKQRILENPYLIVKIKGISFKQADAIALKISGEFATSKQRLHAFILDFLFQNGDGLGHTWLSLPSLKKEVKISIGECADLLEELIAKEIETPDSFYIEGDKIGLRYHHFIESEILKSFIKISLSEPLEISDEVVQSGISIAEEKQGFKFTEEQKEILIGMTKNNFNLITGKAGTGKSTLLRGLTNIYRDYSIGACALSAKASKRIEETTGHNASTIHRLLGAQGEGMYMFNKTNKLPYDVIIVDEASMVNAEIFYDLLVAIESGTKVILCGDSKQLPPIGFGNVFSDVLERGDFYVNRLTKILRQAEKSGIIKDANMIREGISPVKHFEEKIVHGENEDMFYMFRDDKFKMRRIAINMFMKSVEEVGVENAFILTPRKDNVTNSSLQINKKIQDLLIDKDMPSIEFGKRIFRVGCKVIHRVNNYDKNIFNGEIGFVKEILTDAVGKAIGAVVEYEDKEIVYNKIDISELDYAYALTTHLYQGSEADVVIGIIDKSHYIMLDTTFLYTMITRAKSRFLLLAEPEAFERCLKNNKSTERQTWLMELNINELQ